MQTLRSLLLASVLPLFLQAIYSPSYAAGSCVPGQRTLCLAENRFRVEAMLGTSLDLASALPLTETSGGFWFFDSNNIDVAVKIVDASLIDGHFWVFCGGLSDLQYTVKITDTDTADQKTRIFTNPQGVLTSEPDFSTFDAPSKSNLKVADLVADFKPTISGLSVSFTDLSTGQPDQWCWNFGDSPESQCDSVIQNPQHSYVNPGSYSVHLVVSREEGPASTISGKTKTVNVTSQPPPACTFTLTSTSQPFGTKAGNGQVTVRASAPSCSWAAVSNDSFLRIRSGASGTGDGTVKFRVSANPCCPRSGILTIANQQVTIAQTGSCSFAPVAASFRAEGEKNNKVSVIAPPGCPWTVSKGSGSDFIQIMSSTTGSGSGDLFYDVEPNPAATARTGSLSFDNIAGPKFSVSQDPAPCKFSLAQRSQEVPGGAGTYTVSVNAPTSCDWTAAVQDSPDSFVSIDQTSASDSGNGAVSYKVEANDGEARRQDLLIAGKTFTVIQSGCASFDRKQNLGASAGSSSITVSASPACNWEVKNLSPSFLIITSVTGECDSGNLSFCGNGTISYSVDENPYSLARKGTVTIAGTDFSVYQSGCARIEPQSSPEEIPSRGDTRIVKVTAPASCSWIAESDVDFIDILEILGDTPGSGNGEVRYRVSSTLLSRYGSLSIAGNTFKIHQEGTPVTAPCILSGESDIQAFGPLGGISTLQVTAASSCSWRIGTDSSFIGTSAVATQGSGTVPFCVAANRHVQRSGLLAVSETDPKKTFFPITQEAPDINDPAACPTDDPTALCLQGGRFEVRVTVGDAPNFGDFFHPAGVARSARVGIGGSQSESTGYFWYSDPVNPELIVKVLDGRVINGSFWVYSGALTSRFYVITVTDTETGRKTFFCNVNGSFQSFGDTTTLTSP